MPKAHLFLLCEAGELNDCELDFLHRRGWETQAESQWGVIGRMQNQLSGIFHDYVGRLHTCGGSP